MSYFADQYSRLSYPKVTNTNPGLYNAQFGAIHALAAHFTIDDRPAIVTMPTGSGKTAVLMMLPFVLKSARTLIITPSKLVRGQITEDFETLKTLREISVLPDNIVLPRVLELDKRIKSTADWEALQEYDVIISTPNCTSPGYEGIPDIPPDLFDLLIIDEAHHSPARTWAALLEAMDHCQRALFSATPFRRDKAEIPGRFIYNYPLSRAYEDRIFGKISYIQVNPEESQDSDIAIALQTAKTFAEDQAAGLNHCVMVRTDRKTRAEELATIYKNQTHLRLKVIHSGLSSRVVKSIITEMDNGELDGIICVNMMGEGFNFPRLKIAAVHSPHKSLEVTLQFIGRFARTNASNIGEAKFIAILNDIELERKKIFDEGAVWQEIIPELSYGRIENELHIREIIEEFKNPLGADERFTDLSLYSLYPRSHVKIYDLQEDIDLRHLEIPPLGNQEICYLNPTKNGDALVIITREISSPKWSAGDNIINTEYELFILYYDKETRLLFINSSHSVDGTYETLAKSISPNVKALQTGQVRKVVREIVNKRIFNIGMRNIQAANTRESYRIVAASDAQIDPADARRYRQGHVFLTGEEGGERKTIGYSSGAKVWSTLSNQIPELLDWCKELGLKIRSTSPLITHSGLDYLDAGQAATTIPEHIIYVQWNREAFDFTNPTHIKYQKDNGEIFRGHILDLDLSIDREHTSDNQVRVIVSGEGLELSVDFSLENFYTPVGVSENRIIVTRGNASDDFIDYLNQAYLDFYTTDGALFSGNELFEPKEDAHPIDISQVKTWDWSNVDIQSEVTADDGRLSVHNKVQQVLEGEKASIIFYDHGNGEIADYVTISEDRDETIFTFYHCKGSASSAAGSRVEDVYEVTGQAQKSVAWAGLSRFEKRVHYKKRPIHFVRGNNELLQQILERAKDRRSHFEIKIVQPGISRAKITNAIAECLGATSGHLVGIHLEIITSS